MDLVWRSKLGTKFNIFKKGEYCEWTVPISFFECRTSTMLEF